MKINEEETYEISPLDTGSFMHDVIDTFFQEIDSLEISEEELEKIVEEIINEKLKLEKNYKFTNTAKFIILTNKLKKAIKESIKYIVYQMKNSDFTLAGHELEFNKKDGNIEIYGKIDRLDIGKNEDGEYIRIIDYKSSGKKVDLNEMMAGTQIQLMTYIDAIAEEQNKQPAGIFYFGLVEQIVNQSQNLSDEEIEKQIKKQFKMNGIILADVKVVKMMDKSLESGYSDIVPVYIDKNGEVSKGNSSAVTKEEFSNLQKTIRKIIKKIANEILAGKIDIKPMYNKSEKKSSCEYCAYKSICAFNSKINSYEYLQKKSKELILEEIKGEN